MVFVILFNGVKCYKLMYHNILNHFPSVEHFPLFLINLWQVLVIMEMWIKYKMISDIKILKCCNTNRPRYAMTTRCDCQLPEFSGKPGWFFPSPSPVCLWEPVSWEGDGLWPPCQRPEELELVLLISCGCWLEPLTFISWVRFNSCWIGVGNT